MDIHQLECLIEVCKYHNFTRAANALFLSQSSISKNIAALEQELGVSLLERSRHNVTPTKAGVYFSREAQRIVSEIDHAAERVKQIAAGKQGFLRIGVSDELDLNGLLPGFLNRFSMKYPDIEISISIHSYKDLPSLVHFGTLDVTFGPCTYAVGQEISDLKAISINRAIPRLYYSRDHAKANKPDLKPEDFSDGAYIALRNRFSKTLTRLKSIGLTFRNVIYVDTLQAMKLYVEANQGVCVLGESYTIINSEKVNSIVVEGMECVGTDLFVKAAPANESATLFVQELQDYLKRCTR